jgi:hypothetical protein
MGTSDLRAQPLYTNMRSTATGKCLTRIDARQYRMGDCVSGLATQIFFTEPPPGPEPATSAAIHPYQHSGYVVERGGHGGNRFHLFPVDGRGDDELPKWQWMIP